MKISRNQYLIVPQNVEIDLLYSKRLNFGSYHVLLGERSQYTMVSRNDKNILLIGYAIDVKMPERSEVDMLFFLSRNISIDGDNIADLTLYWGGRWVVFIQSENGMLAMTDCCGLKQLFYVNNVFGSQSRYVAYATGIDQEKKSQMYIKLAMSVEKEYSWPLNATLYSSINRLLPNHLYNRGVVHRVYPSDFFSGMTVAERITVVSTLLRNSLIAASHRARLAVTLTAGWDSRLVLSACSGVKDKIDVVTLKYHHIPENHIDIQIPSLLCNKYGFAHRVLSCRGLSPGFVSAYKEHSENAHVYWMQMAQSVYDYGYEEWLWTKGACNEICRNSSGILYNWQVNAKILSKMYGIFPNDYSHKVINEWLKGARSFAKITHYSVLDLFYWEHRLGSWFAECLNEADVVGESFTPFNVRAYFELIKTVPINMRISPNYYFFEQLLKENGISLDIPINPNRYNSLFDKIKCLLKNRCHLLYGIILNI